MILGINKANLSTHQEHCLTSYPRNAPLVPTMLERWGKILCVPDIDMFAVQYRTFITRKPLGESETPKIGVAGGLSLPATIRSAPW